jgi:hypothetical protein
MVGLHDRLADRFFWVLILGFYQANVLDSYDVRKDVHAIDRVPSFGLDQPPEILLGIDR